jgi:hypothetical protein
MNRTIFAAGACALALTSAAQGQSLPDSGGATVLDTITVTTPDLVAGARHLLGHGHHPRGDRALRRG